MLANLIQILVDALSLGSIYAVTALGIGLIYSVMRLINFAHGDYISVCVFSMLIPAGEGVAHVFIGQLPSVILVPVIISVGVMMAVASEALLYRRLRGAEPATMMIASFALGRAIQSLLLMIFGSRAIGVNLWSELMQPLTIGSVRIPILQLVIIGVTAISLGILVLFLRRTMLGVAMRASSENFRMAQMLGVRANRIIMTAFAISGGLAATTGLLVLSQTGVADIRMGQPILLFAFIAAAIGGLGNLTGAVLTSFLIGAVSVVLQVILPIDVRPFRDAFVFAVVIGILIVRPDGLFASKLHKSRI